jgi:hypothetical protein
VQVKETIGSSTDALAKNRIYVPNVAMYHSTKNDESTTMIEEVLCRKRTLIRLSHEKQENVTTFIINNSQCMTMFLDEFKVNFSGETRGVRNEKAKKLLTLLECI